MTMQKLSHRLHHLMQLTTMVLTPVVDAVRFLRLCLWSPATLAAENLFRSATDERSAMASGLCTRRAHAVQTPPTHPLP